MPFRGFASRRLAGASLLVSLSLACSSGSRPAARTSSPGNGSSPDGAWRPLPSPLPDIVARVNGEPIRLTRLLPAARKELRRPSNSSPERQQAEALRRALTQYVDRELLLQEAIARGVAAEDRDVQWTYDQMRREHADDAAWAAFLAGEGLDPQALRAELRAQLTIETLLAREARSRGVTAEAARAALLEALRPRARIELFL